MRDQSIRTHIQNLEQQGELLRFIAEIDPDAVLALCAAGDPFIVIIR